MDKYKKNLYLYLSIYKPNIAGNKSIKEIWIDKYFPGGPDGKASVYNEGDPGLIPGLGRYSGEGNGNPLQYYCLENPMDGGAW